MSLDNEENSHYPPFPLRRYVYIPIESTRGYTPLSSSSKEDSSSNSSKAHTTNIDKTQKLPASSTVTTSSTVNRRKRSFSQMNTRKDKRCVSHLSLLEAIHADTIIQQEIQLYTHFDESLGSNKLSPSDSIPIIVLEYPGLNAQERFPIVYPIKETCFNPMHDLFHTVQYIVQECMSKEQSMPFGSKKQGILRNVIKACKKRDYAALDSEMKLFNSQMGHLKKCLDTVKMQTEITGDAGSYDLICHVLEQSYSRAVAPQSHLLRHYPGFSNNVYGEIKHNFVDSIIKEAKIKPHFTFLDMGSGIGNVILQVAAQCLCECFGIEIMEKPALLAERQKQEFLSRMRYYGKPCGKIDLFKGDFLEHEEIHGVIKRADVIFVNNYAFNAELNQSILAKLLDIKDSCKVVSLRSFVSVDRKPSLHRIHSIENIFTVQEYHFGKEAVSWMNEPGKYYIHSVDRKQLQELHGQ